MLRRKKTVLTSEDWTLWNQRAGCQSKKKKTLSKLANSYISEYKPLQDEKFNGDLKNLLVKKEKEAMRKGVLYKKVKKLWFDSIKFQIGYFLPSWSRWWLLSWKLCWRKSSSSFCSCCRCCKYRRFIEPKSSKFKSGILPKFLGVFLMLGCLGYLIHVFGRLIFPGYSELAISSFVTLPATIGELGICLWLLIRGAKEKPITVN